MKIDRAGVPFVAGALVPAVVLVAIHAAVWALPFLALAAAMVFFFRDPERRSPGGAGLVLAPADGRVVVAGAPQDGAAPCGDWVQVSIFLSPLDVHVNRMPVAGAVTKVDYRRGRCWAAYRPEATFENERNEVWLDAGPMGPVVCRQITGVLVRRVVCRARPGDVVRAGDRFGVMKFGSRIDLFLPAATVLKVRVGDRVRAGETIMAAQTV
jgi:phosphatidylserine decarboxylase